MVTQVHTISSQSERTVWVSIGHGRMVPQRKEALVTKLWRTAKVELVSWMFALALGIVLWILSGDKPGFGWGVLGITIGGLLFVLYVAATVGKMREDYIRTARAKGLR